ncbi:MAG: hypothetical protein KDA42_07215, partial [Planctomycetales bacterium]|nr:hypothetical protein [Planctomycetales bacterium]
MPAFKRRQLFVDPKVQGALIMRTTFYWFMSVLTMSMFLLCWRVVSAPGQRFADHIEYLGNQYGLALLGSLVILPMLCIDIVKLSNRFVGPLYRLRRAMRDLAEG